MYDAAGYLFQICPVGGVCFLLKPAGYWRNRQGFFLNGRDSGWVSQLMGTQLANILIFQLFQISNGYHNS
jgi:hypothetical protein